MSTSPQKQSLEEQISYDERGLVPCVVQDWASGEVEDESREIERRHQKPGLAIIDAEGAGE